MADKILALPLSFREAVFFGLTRDRQTAALQAILHLAKDKADKRSLKRILYELDRAGVDVEPRKKNKPLFKRPVGTEEIYPCFVSAVDGRNERLIILNEAAPRGVRTLQVYDRSGDTIAHFHYDETSRKKMRLFIDDLRNVRHIPLFEVESEFGYYLIERVRALSRQAGQTEPSGFLHAYSRMNGPGALPERHPVADRLDGQAVLNRLPSLEDSERLHGEVDFSAWIVDEETVHALQISLQDTATSGLVISGGQQSEQFEAKINRAIDRFFTEQRRLAYAERLRDTAFLLVNRDLTAQAETAAALAMALENPQRAPSSIPFFRYMLTKLLAPETKKDDQSPSGLIV